MTRILYGLAALALLSGIAPAASALAPGMPATIVPPRDARPARADAEGLSVAIDAGPFHQTPGDAPARAGFIVSYTDAADPLRLGLFSLDVAIDAILESEGVALAEPPSLTLKSDGRAAEGTLAIEFYPGAPAWQPATARLFASGTNALGTTITTEASTQAIPRQVCAVRVDGTLPYAARPEKGAWPLTGAVYVRNEGNGPLAITVASVAAPEGTTIEPSSRGEIVVPAHGEGKVAYEVTLPEDADVAGWQWRVSASAHAAQTPPDGSAPTSCGGADTVRIGDEKEIGPYYGAPGLGGIGAAAALALASLALARRRR